MINHPSAAELSEAIVTFDAEPVAPDDARQAFLARVADNARATLAREATHGARLEAEAVERLTALLGETDHFETLNNRLCEALRGALSIRAGPPCWRTYGPRRSVRSSSTSRPMAG
jgi:hypothetical protein